MVSRGFVKGHPGFGRARKVLCQEKPLLGSAADGCQQLPMVFVAFKLRPHRAPLLLPLETTSQSGICSLDVATFVVI